MPFIGQRPEFGFAALEVLTGHEHAAQRVDQPRNVKRIETGIGGRG